MSVFSKPASSGGLSEIADGSITAAKLADGAVTAAKIDTAAVTAAKIADAAFFVPYGLTLSQAADTDHDITVAVGKCRDSGDNINMSLTSALTKQIDADWAAGSDAGGIASALTLSVDTWYHVFIVEVSGGSFDVGFDTSVAAANLLADTGGTRYRRLGSVLTDGSSNIIGFSMHGDTVLWNVPVTDVNVSNQGTAEVSYPLTVPTGFSVEAILVGRSFKTGASHKLRIYNPSQTDTATTGANCNAGAAAVATDQAFFQIKTITDTSAQINCIADAASTDLEISTIGWTELNRIQ